MNAAAHILVVDDEPDICGLVKEILEDEGFEVSTAANAATAREARRSRLPDLILLDIWMPDTDGITLLKEWSAQGASLNPVIVMSGHGTVETAVEATRLGAYDFIEKPLTMAKLLLAVRHALEATRLRRENIGLKREIHVVHEPLGKSGVMVALREQVKRVAHHDTPVLIVGESGSGKEVSARYLHANSNRRTGPFVRVSIGGVGDDNAASELFGVEDGENIHFGWMEQANGGTLFLEDIADMNPHMQTRLLSALNHGAFMRVDGTQPVSFKARIVAATSHNPDRAVESGRLREDLYYHLNVVPLTIPPLRDHKEDVPELLSFYVDFLATRENLSYRRFGVDAQNRLRNYAWPGNIRELKNLVHRLLILGSGSDIALDEIDGTLGNAPRSRSDSEPRGLDLPLKEAREQFERDYLEHQIRLANGNISRVASKVGLERTHLYRKLRALGIDPKNVVGRSD